MSTKLNFGRDTQGFNAYAPAPAIDKYSATLAAAGNSTITLPGNAQSWIVAFSYQPGSDIWVAYNATAAAPVSTAFAATTSEFLPASRTLSSLRNDGTTATTINFYNNGAGTADIGVVLYANT